MHPCLRSCVAIGRAVVFYVRMPTHFVQELNVGTVGASFGERISQSHMLWFLPKSFSRAISRLVLTLTLPSDVVWFKIDNRRLTAVDCGSRYERWEMDIYFFIH